MKCPYCSHENSASRETCIHCGKKLPRHTKLIAAGAIGIALVLTVGLVSLVLIGRGILAPPSDAKLAHAQKRAEHSVMTESSSQDMQTGDEQSGQENTEEVQGAVPEGSIAAAEKRAQELKAAQAAGKLTAQLSDDRKRIEEQGYLQASIKASHDSTNLGGKKYSAASAVDGNDKTSWQEGDSGDGLGAKLRYELDGEYEIRYLIFKLGNWKDEKSYLKNNRPSKLTISVGGESAQVTFPDVQQEFVVKLSKDVKAKEVGIVVDQVYQGSSFSDTCITEIEISGKKAAEPQAQN